MSDARPASDGRPVHLDDAADLDAFVDREGVALVEFYTEGCSLCAGMEPVLGNVARSTDAAVGLVNPRDDPPLIERFDVTSVPLLVLFVDGDPVDRRAEGFVAGDDLAAWLAEHGA
jgi:thioredoxin 1